MYPSAPSIPSLSLWAAGPTLGRSLKSEEAILRLELGLDRGCYPSLIPLQEGNVGVGSRLGDGIGEPNNDDKGG